MAKTIKDPRHKRRQKIIQDLFAWDFNKKTPLNPSVQEIIDKIEKIDQTIKNCAPKWPLEKINRADLAILRLAIYELFFNKNIPDKVAIDEAVELAKEFGSENSPGFINGALGAAYNIIKERQESNDEKTEANDSGKKD